MVTLDELLLILARKELHANMLEIAEIEDYAMSGRILYTTYAINKTPVKIVVQWKWDRDIGWFPMLWNGAPCDYTGKVLNPPHVTAIVN